MVRNGSGQTVREKLLTEMRSGIFAGQERLPRESVLAQMLGISRTQLRDSLGSLEREGFISRRHGIGTVINHHVLDVTTRMDLETEFMDMIRNAGYCPSIAFVEHEEFYCGEDIAKRLKISQGEPVLKVSRLITADGKPAIYCEDYIDCGKIKDNSYNEESLTMPIFHFLEKYCGLTSAMDLTEIRPAVADARLAGIFGIPQGTPLLYMDEVDYDIGGEPIFCSAEYYADGIIKHTVMRKKF